MFFEKNRRINKRGEFYLSEHDFEENLKDINVKYNFIIQPIKNNETFINSSAGAYILFTVPRV